MTLLLSVLAALILLAIAALHAAWAFGSTFPAGSEKQLAHAVAGFAGRDKMPPRAASAFVALVLLACAVWPFVMSGDVLPGLPRWMALWGGIKIAIIFSLRGVIGYMPFWRRLTPQQPFARLDVIYYSPLCLAIALAFATLSWSLSS